MKYSLSQSLPLFFLLFVLNAGAYAQEVRVDDLAFKGNKKMSARHLKKAIVTKASRWYRIFLPWIDPEIYDEDIFLSDLLRVERFYKQEGFLSARVQTYKLDNNKKGDAVSIAIYVDEGAVTRVREVKYSVKSDTAVGLNLKKLLKLLKLKRGKPYREEDLKQDYGKIISEFENHGYPYIKARMKPEFDRENHRVTVEWLLEPGPFCRFGDVMFAGNETVSDKALRHGLGFRTGGRFERKKLLIAQRQIYRLELFQFVSLKTTELENRPRTIPIEVRVKEATLHTLKFGIGYGSEEAFRASVRWRHRNFLGGARVLRLKGKHATRILPLQLEVELSQPYFLSNRNDLIVKPFLKWEDEKSFEARRIGVEITLTRRLTLRTNAFVGVTVERDTVEVKGSVIDTDLEDFYNKSLLRLGLRHDATDRIFNPSRGYRASVFVEEAGRLLSTRFNYLKVQTEHRVYHQVTPGHVIAVKLAAGSMKPIRGSPDTPIEERFFAGGSYSVRGWGRQLLGPVEGGDSIFEGSLEYRRPLYKKISTAFFLDFGNVWPEWDGYDLTDLHYAIGAGLRYNTPIGPIRVDFGWKINKQEIDTRNYEVHLSIGQAF